MRYLILCLLFIASCAPTAPVECESPYIRLEFSDGCCLDEDGDNVCDVDRPEPEVVSEEPEEVVEEPSEPVIVPEEPYEPTITEKYEAEFKSKVKYYSYYLDTDYGKLWVWSDLKDVKYISVENLFEFDTELGSMVKSEYDYLAHYTDFYEAVDERKLPVLSIVQWNESAQEYIGCYVYKSDIYKLENCIKELRVGKPIIFEAFEFVPPESPLDWLGKFHGREPVLVNYNRTMIVSNSRVTVDELFFEDSDLTTKLYIHSGFKGLILVEILKDGRVVDKVEFEHPVFNNRARNWHDDEFSYWQH